MGLAQVKADGLAVVYDHCLPPIMIFLISCERLRAIPCLGLSGKLKKTAPGDGGRPFIGQLKAKA